MIAGLIFAFFLFSSQALAAETKDLASLFERLKTVGVLHNCNFEVVSRDDSNGVRKYMLWAQDRRPSLDFEKRTVTFEYEVMNRDENRGEVVHGQIQSSFGFDAQGVRYRTALNVKLSELGNPKSLLLQEVNLETGETRARVECKAQGEGE